MPRQTAIVACERYAFNALHYVERLHSTDRCLPSQPPHCEQHCAMMWCYQCSYQQPNGHVDHFICRNCEKCTLHCRCVECPSCHQTQNHPADICPACSNGSCCCECSYCYVCQIRVVSVCDRCRRCDSHCTCHLCDGCNYVEPENRWCIACSNCIDCCICSDSTTDRDETPCHIKFREVKTPVFHKAGIGQYSLNKSKRFASLEIEVNSCDKAANFNHSVNSVADKWNAGIVSDGSLDEGGFEINTAPANGDVLLDELREFADILAEQKATVNSSCGLHIHIDARDFTFYDMRRLVLLYEKIEPALFAMMPLSRRDSQYCQPCGQEYAASIRENRLPKQSKLKLIENVYKDHVPYIDPDSKRDKTGQILKHMKRAKYNDARYHALNIHSWIYRGTVECRLHTGTVSYDKLSAWAMLWTSIVDTAYRMSEPAIQKLDGTSLQILRSLAPNDEVRAYIDSRTAKFADTAESNSSRTLPTHVHVIDIVPEIVYP